MPTIWLSHNYLSKIKIHCLNSRQAHHRNDIGSHIREAHAAGVEGAHQQLPVFISVLVLRYIVGFDDLLLQHDHQLETNRGL